MGTVSTGGPVLASPTRWRGAPGAVRFLLAFLALSALVPGVWATLAPEGFHSGFPGLGQSWVARSGAFQGHLLADVGAFYLAFGMMFAWAALRPRRTLVVPLCVGWGLFSIFHAGWHATNTAGFDTTSALAQGLSLLVVGAAPAAVVVLVRRGGTSR